MPRPYVIVYIFKIIFCPLNDSELYWDMSADCIQGRQVRAGACRLHPLMLMEMWVVQRGCICEFQLLLDTNTVCVDAKESNL